MYSPHSPRTQTVGGGYGDQQHQDQQQQQQQTQQNNSHFLQDLSASAVLSSSSALGPVTESFPLEPQQLMQQQQQTQTSSSARQSSQLQQQKQQQQQQPQPQPQPLPSARFPVPSARPLLMDPKTLYLTVTIGPGRSFADALLDSECASATPPLLSLVVCFLSRRFATPRVVFTAEPAFAAQTTFPLPDMSAVYTPLPHKDATAASSSGSRDRKSVV